LAKKKGDNISKEKKKFKQKKKKKILVPARTAPKPLKKPPYLPKNRPKSPKIASNPPQNGYFRPKTRTASTPPGSRGPAPAAEMSAHRARAPLDPPAP
jgi:hypothetical protein